MKRAVKIILLLVILLVAMYFIYVEYAKRKWGQHLPSSNLAVNDVERVYHYFVPTNPPAGPMSLMVVLQGGDAGPWVFAQQSEFEALAEKEGVILVFPIGKLMPPNEGAWQLNTDAQSSQDIDFVTAMIDDMSTRHAVDSKRVYAIGYSLGSMFSYELACQLSDRFAAIASFAGTMPVNPKSCTPERNVPLMHIHGLEDGIIAYGNTWDWKAWDSVGTMQDIPGLLEYWNNKYQCQNVHQVDADASLHIVHDQCTQDVRVEHHGIKSNGHEWPESINGISTHQVMWSFVSEFSLP